MDAAQRQRILGYFLQEAREYLAVLQEALDVLEREQPAFQAWEQVADWFRAAHSLKGGAAILELEGIRQLALRLENCFKILRDQESREPIALDPTIVQLLRQGVQALEGLVQQVEQTGELPDEMGQQVVLANEPAFIQLEALLQIAVQGAGVMTTWESVAPAPEAPAEAATAEDLNLEELLAELEVPQAAVPEAPANTPEELASLAELFGATGGEEPAGPPSTAEDLGALEDLFTMAAETEAPNGILDAQWPPLVEESAAPPEEVPETEDVSTLLGDGELGELGEWADWESLVVGDGDVNEATGEASPPSTDLEMDLMASLAAQGDDLELEIGEWTEGEELGDGTAEGTEAVAPEREDAWVMEMETVSRELTQAEGGDPLGLPNLEAGEAEIPDLAAPNTAWELVTDEAGLLGNTTAELEAALGSFAQGEPESEPTEPVAELGDLDLEQALTNLDDLVAATTPEGTEAEDFDWGDTGELELALAADVSLPGAEEEGEATPLEDLADLLEDVELPSDLPDLETMAQELGAVAPDEPASALAEEPTSPMVLMEQTMRVPVRQLDNLSNLIGELVVSRNTLNEDQNRLRQFLENLLHQAHQLNDLSQRMQDLYERSLLEGALRAGRTLGASEAGGQHSTGAEFDALEMDRFTGFHILSQEIAERVLRVREAAADIGFMVEAIDEVVRSFQRITTGLQEGINSARMEPFSRVTDRLPRAVRNVALKCGKQVQLEIEGRETLIDKMILEKLVDPMTHLVNNAIVHGIGTPEQRRAAGQSPTGRIVIRAGHQGNQTVITVSDDGVGINPDRVKAKAIERGLITPEQAQAMSKQEVYQLLFMPGFSTRDQTDEFAGRGVGLDVVRKNLAEIRGTVVVDSEVGKGTTFTIRLPLTLSISKSLPCLVSHARVAFPMDGVADVPVDVMPEMITLGPDGKPLLEWAGQRIPLRRLSELLHYGRLLGRGNIYGTSTQEGLAVVVVHSLGRYVAFQVDQVLSEQEVVIKQLSGPVPKPLGIAGATILGDGRIMMIADVLELVDLALGQLRPPSMPLWQAPTIVEPETTDEPTVLIVDDSITVREMLSMTFSNKGYRVEQARDGLEAWEKLQDGLPCDLMFCDIEMPRMDGLELLSKVRRDPKLKDLPIAMLTSRGAERHRQMAIQLGANAYFTKPYLEETLLEAARRLLQGETLVKPNR
ncbi:MAG: response regulator [Gloeomargarita sp. GMQP_bins_120]